MNIIRILALLALYWLFAVGARAATLVDLGLEDQPPLPTATDRDGSPYYITNFSRMTADGPVEAVDVSVSVETFRVGAASVVHVGYGPAAVADAGISLGTLGDMTVEGAMHVGKAATQGERDLPDAATVAGLNVSAGGDLNIAGGVMTATADAAGSGVAIDVSGTTRITGGGSLELRGADEDVQATLSTGALRIDGGGRLALNGFSTATTTAAAPGTGDEAFYNVVVGRGGTLALNGGVRPASGAGGDSWMFRGLDVSAGGGLAVEEGGVLAAGPLGGAVSGTAGQRLIVRRGGALDASLGVVQISGMDGVALYGAYTAGYGASGITLLDASETRVDVYSGATLGMSRALQRYVNALPLVAIDNAGILRGGEIAFERGVVPALRSGMGTYTLALGSEAGTGVDILYVAGVENGVLGDGSAADRRRFRDNMTALWSPGGMGAVQAGVIYDLTVAATPTVTASGVEGELNREVLEAFVAGRGQAVGMRGSVDVGVYELYNGGAQFGVNAAAYGAASEMLSGLARRTDFAVGEMGRRGGIATALGWGSYALPEDHAHRAWVGGFGRIEEADLDYGIAGYKYTPRGFMAGYDRLFGDGVVVGGAVAYGSGGYEDKAALSNDSEITSYSVGAYAGYRRGAGFSASAYGSVSYLRNDLRDVRGGMGRRADFASYAWAFGGELGYELRPAEGVEVKPTVGLERIRAASRAHNERLDDISVIRVGRVKRDSTLLPIEVELGFDVRRWEAARLRLRANFGYAYDFAGDGLDGSLTYSGLINASAVPVAERGLGRHRFTFGGGLGFSGVKLDFDARYDYFERDKYASHQFQGNAGVKF